MHSVVYNEKTKIWSNPERVPTFNPNVSLGQLILQTMKMNPSKIAQISDNNGIQLTQGEIYLKTIRAAQNLQKIGLQKADNIAIISRFHHFLAPIAFAAMSIATPIHVLDPTYTSNEIYSLLKLTKPKIIFCDAKYYNNVREAAHLVDNSILLVTFDNVNDDGIRLVDEFFAETGRENQFIPVDIGDGMTYPLVILCSSGSTGPMKPVTLSHASVVITGSKLFTQLTTDDVILNLSVFSWISGFLALTMTALYSLQLIITTDPVTPDQVLEILDKYKVSGLITPPSLIQLLLQSSKLASTNLTNFRNCWVGGNRVSEELCKTCLDVFPCGLNISYGMTETSGFVSMTGSSNTLSNGCVGLLHHGFQAKIINDNGSSCGIDEEGELHLRSEFPYLGYYGNEEATSDSFDADGWFKTGDICRFDENGYLYVVARKKELVKYKNFPLSPFDLENTILNNCHGVQMVCVTGIPDRTCDELPAALVVKNDESTVTAKEIHAIIREKFADTKQLRGGIYFVPSLPMTSTGKIKRYLAKELAVDLYAAGGDNANNNEN